MALLEFFGETCPHCVEMKPLIAKLEEELGVKVEQNEVWNNDENAQKQKEYDKGLCGGVPFFINTDSGKHICGSTDYDSLKAWAEGK
ncbi:thioredoxin family protein [Candidatus Uhrbacteria bacterium]|jgi:thiol-disulfide isomerase/thioredoxin|nr:thioredoxin family protein [Candidatus Uhrbacteria bacterium]